MKNVLKLVFIVVLAFSFSTTTFAQNADYKSNIYAGAGFSLLGAAVDLFEVVIDSVGGGADARSLPALQVNYDYGVTKWFSVGAGFSYQNFNINVTDFPLDSLGTVTEDFSINANRIVVGVRAMFHYANNDKVDLYSGIRLNYKAMRVSGTSSDPDLDLSVFDVAIPFGVQVVPFAARFYVTDNIGLSLETAIGAPHFLSIGANYRM